MDLLIKNMEMPTEGRLVLAICPNGHVYRYYGNKPIPRGYGGCGIEAKQEALIESDAIAIPPHGRLIDAGALDKIKYTDDFYETSYIELDDILEAPTVLEASK